MPQAAVIGNPVAHSLSPVMHRAAYAALGLNDWHYEAIQLEPGQVPQFVASLDRSWAGLSVTMPFKRDLQPFLATQSDLALAVGSVNTVVVKASPAGEASVELHGYNTDVYGIVHALADAQGVVHTDGMSTLDDAVIVGGGATAASALAAVLEHGCRTPVVLVRSPERAGAVLDAAARLGVDPRLVTLDASTIATVVAGLSERSAVVSTLPAGAVDPYVEAMVEGLARRDVDAPALLDVVYNPWPTLLADAWSQRTQRWAGGFDMLVHQAEGQVRLMTGHRPPVDVMRAAGQRELEARMTSTGT